MTQTPLFRDLLLGFKAFRDVLRFGGRSRRTELIAFLIVSGVVQIIAEGIVSIFVDSWYPLKIGIGLSTRQLIDHVFTIPLFALIARRVHDFGWPAWPVMLAVSATIVTKIDNERAANMAADNLISYGVLIGLPGALLAVLALVAPGTEGANRYGPNPRLEPEPKPSKTVAET